MGRIGADLSGRQVGAWSVGKYAGNCRWHCTCACGTERKVATGDLVHGKTKSCGCMRASAIAKAKTKHGGSASTEYRIWASMKARCINVRNKRFARYGGRGIAVHADWMNDFSKFLADMGCRPSPLHTIERIDNNRNYEPGNCRWATKKEQALNTSRNRRIVVGGREATLGEWAGVTAVKRETIARRLNAGWSPERAIAEVPDQACNWRNKQSAIAAEREFDPVP